MAAINSGDGNGGDGGGGGSKRQRLDGLDGRSETVASDAIEVDRISSLPEELRLHMLTRLPLKDAIRTGALARGWRDLWKRRWAHRASREVHLRFRDDPRRELDAMEREPRPRRRLERFSLNIGISTLKASELRRFVEYTAECGVEDMHVETSKGKLARKLNFHLPLLNRALACLTLRDITVSMFYNGARWTLHPQFHAQFHALEVIRFVSVSFRPEAFAKMMALCPSLLTLDMRRCECIGWEFIDRLPPNLRSLTIAGCGRFSSNHGLHLVRVPPTLRSFRYHGRSSDLPLSIACVAALSDLYIQLYYDSVTKNEWNINKLRKSLPTDLSNLNVLTICYTALTGASVLPANGANDQLPNFILHSLKELHLLMSGMKAVDLSNLYMFLRTLQCPNLERLFVEFSYGGYVSMQGSIDQVCQEPPEVGWDNLVIVKVMNFNWCPFEIQLVSFLLRKARSLRKLLIVTYKLTPVDSPGTPKADLSLLKEALANGKVMLLEYTDSEATQPYHEAKLF